MSQWILILALLTSTSAMAFNQEVTVSTKVKNGSGEVVYATYGFPNKKLMTGDTFEIYVGNQLAAKFMPQKGFSLTSLSTRLRLKSTNNVRAILTKKGAAKKQTATRKIVISRSFKMPTKCDTTEQHKVKRDGHSHKILFKHHMSKSCYIGKIIFSGKSGSLVVVTTSMLTRNPYFKFGGTSETKNLSVTSKVIVNKR